MLCALADVLRAVAGRVAVALALHRAVALGAVFGLGRATACCIRHAMHLFYGFKKLTQPSALAQARRTRAAEPGEAASKSMATRASLPRPPPAGSGEIRRQASEAKYR